MTPAAATRLLRAVLSSLLLCGPFAAGASAQGGLETGTITGVVTDETGAVLPGVTITAESLSTGQIRTVVSDESGGFRLSGLRPDRYSLTAQLQGFGTVLRPQLTVNVGSILTVDLSMQLSNLEETVTVSGDAGLVQQEKTTLSTVITEEQIESLPSNGRNYLDFVLLTPAVVENTTTTNQGAGINLGGAQSQEAALLVDGFYNMDDGFALPRQRYSQDAIQEFQVVSFGATAEFGRAIGGIVNAVTKSGGNQLRGSAFGFFRDKSLNAQTVLERQRGEPKSAFDRQQYGGTLGGPIRKSRTFFFGSFERQVENTPFDNNIDPAAAAAIGLPPADVGTQPSFYKSVFAMGKVDHSVSNDQKIQGAFVMSRWTEHNRTFASFNTRSRVQRLRGLDFAYQFKWNLINGNGRWLHEAKFAYFPREYGVTGPSEGGPPLTPDGQINLGNLDATAPPRVNISGVANFGSASLNNLQYTDPIQVLYSSTLGARDHTVKFGADVMVVWKDDYNFGTAVGTYTFANLAEFLAGRYRTYTQTFGDSRIQRLHTHVSGFVQDSWTPHDRLTLNYGLRYDLELQPEYQGISFGKDYNNLGPRFALSYDLTGRGTTFAKVSTGLYYDRLFLNTSTQTFRGLKQAPQQFVGTWRFGEPGAPTYPETLRQPPASTPGLQDVWIMPDDLAIPTSAQTLATIEHALTPTFAVSGSVLYSRSWNKEIIYDTNLVFDNATQSWLRPDPSVRSIQQYRFVGRAEYLGLVIEATRRTDRLSFGANLTLARARNHSDAFNGSPSDQRFLEEEWGPATDTPRVRFVANATYALRPDIQLAAIYRARTGYAIDPRVGSAFDINGDGRFNDRTPGFTRNPFRGPGTQTLDGRFAWTLPVHNGRLQLLLEAFNVFNRDNVRTVFNLYGPDPDAPDARFGDPLTYFPPREVQLGIRATF